MKIVSNHEKKIMDSFLRTVKRTLPDPVKQLLRRALFPLRNKGLFKPYVIKKDMEGVVFDFLIGDRTGRDWYDRECINNPVWLEMRFIRDQLIEQGDVILECGGHHGCSAILLSNWVGPRGKVVTFEPFPENCDILEKNIKLNRLKNVSLQRNAVGAERGKITIDASISAVNLSGKGIEVDVTCLDVFEHLNPTFLKIDVEGFEMQVLQGAKNILAKRPKLAIEIHAELLSQYGCSVGDLFKLIKVENYKLWIQWKDNQPPEEYDMKTPIEKRVHLFCVPVAIHN
jgi:FkbM family methyltransferase